LKEYFLVVVFEGAYDFSKTILAVKNEIGRILFPVLPCHADVIICTVHDSQENIERKTKEEKLD